MFDAGFTRFNMEVFKGEQGRLPCMFGFLLSLQLSSLIILQSQLAMFPPLAGHVSNFRSTQKPLLCFSYSHREDSTHLHTFAHQQRAPPSHEVSILASHHDHQWVDWKYPLHGLCLASRQTESQDTDILELIINGTCTSLDCGRQSELHSEHANQKGLTGNPSQNLFAVRDAKQLIVKRPQWS